MKELLRLDHVSCGYKDGFTISDISFSLTEGSFAGIIGRNGSGKTTLFRGISGDIPLLSGHIWFDGKDFTQLSLKSKAQQMAIVSQFIDAANLTAEEYVLMGRLPYRQTFQFFDHPEDREIAHHFMNLTDTYKHRHKLMSELSGGEQQMVCIASALSQQPRLLLLDEPTSHLDITHQVRFLNLIQRLNQDMNLSVIMIIHDLTMAAEYCDYLLMMKQGRLCHQGTPEQVLTYQHIEEVYDTVVLVNSNPVSGKPAVFPVSARELNKINRSDEV